MIGRAALLVGSILFSLLVLELGCRLWRGPHELLDWHNRAVERLELGLNEQRRAHQYDATLGWTPVPNFVSADYSTDASGYRRVPPTPDAGPPVVLATGASFAEGEEVGDGETWPAYLQALSKRKAVNAAVIGYALDQAVLRTEQAVAAVKPAVVVLSFTADNVRSSELKVAWTHEKPYFELHDGELQLRNTPVPRTEFLSSRELWLPRLLGWSVLIDEIVGRMGWQAGWFYDEVRALPAGSGETLACPLMRRLAAVGIPVLVVAQYPRGTWQAAERERGSDRRLVRQVLGCAAQAGLGTLDLFDTLQDAVKSRGLDALYRYDHHAPEGNRLVADAIERELVRRGWLMPTPRL
jgi:hypothetical protein